MKLKKARSKNGKIIPGTYVSDNGKYYIDKGFVGWNLHEVNKYGGLDYLCTYDTLRDIRNDPNL